MSVRIEPLPLETAQKILGLLEEVKEYRLLSQTELDLFELCLSVGAEEGSDG